MMTPSTWDLELIITWLRMNGLTPTTSFTSRTSSATSCHSVKALAYFRTTAWALVPRIFDLRSSSKPLITERTTVRHHTPTATASTEMTVMTERKEVRFLAIRWRRAM